MSGREPLPEWVVWQERPFPDANLLLLTGREPATVDSGFVGHAQDTVDWIRSRTTDLKLVVNTHWHSDHVGGNALLQTDGAGIAAARVDADAVNRRDPGCCVAEYLDQPVAPYTIDQPLNDGDILTLGEADWQVISTPGHTPGHICLWQPDEQLLAVGDALTSYDIGWVNLALDGPDAATTALASLQRLVNLNPQVLLTAHGPIPADTDAALDVALRRAQRLVDDPTGAIWHGARRILAFALMIRNGIAVERVTPYLLERTWLVDAAQALAVSPDSLADQLVQTMLASGAIAVTDGGVHATAPHRPVGPETLNAPFPRAW